MSTRSDRNGRSRISYIINSSSESNKHTAGINALALDRHRQILYSAGRDSIIHSWHLNLDHIMPTFLKKEIKIDIEETMDVVLQQEQDDSIRTQPEDSSMTSRSFPSRARILSDRLTHEVSASRRSVSFSLQQQQVARSLDSRPDQSSILQTSLPKIASPMDYVKIVESNSKFYSHREQIKSCTTSHAQQYIYHTDWVNDIALTEDGRHLVTGSSDRSVCLWNTVEKSDPLCLGNHKDFVKRVALCSSSRWVASGGFDKRINLWDIGEARSEKPIITFESTASTGSIYALACNSSGTMIASGSPEKVVSLWDHRSGTRRVSQLQGHTDNIRDLLISADGEWIISASSDTTIKLWSIKKPSQCYTTYSHYDDTVLSLYSNDPDLNVFWAGGRDGWVSKLSTTPLPLRDDFTVEGLFVCKEEAPVFDLVSYHHAFLWTATPSSDIHRWRDVPFGRKDGDQDLLTVDSGDTSKFILPQTSLTEPMTHDDTASLISFTASLYSHRNLFRRDFGSQRTENGVVPGTPSAPASPISAKSQVNTPLPYIDSLEDECLPDLKHPVWPHVDEVVQGAPVILKFVQLNSKRHVVTLDSQENVHLWDIISCQRLKSFGKQNLDIIVKQENTTEWIPNWCSIDCKLGVLTIHLDDGKCFDGEMYYQDLGLDVQSENEDQRVILARWVLTYLFFWYILSLHPENKTLQRHAQVDEEVKKLQKTSLGLADVQSVLRRICEVVTEPAETTGRNDKENTSSAGSNGDESTLPENSNPLPVAKSSPRSNSPSNSFIDKLNRFRKRTLTGGSSKEPPLTESSHDASGSQPSPTLSPMKRTSSNQSNSNVPFASSMPPSSEKLQPVLLNYDETPPLCIPDTISIIISYEESSDAHTFLSVFRSPIRSLSQPEIISKLEQSIPGWIYSWILEGITPTRSLSKSSFILLPHPDSSLPSMPQGNNRLTANRMLRVKKVVVYVAERLGIMLHKNSLVDKAERTQSSEEPASKSVFLEILCNDVVLSPRTTLATVKHFIWKGGSDIPLYYRERVTL